MTLCPYCQTPAVEDNYFCENCERQVKCRACDALLRANKSRCLKCGTPIVDIGSMQSPMNEYLLDEKQTTKSSSRRISVRATNEAIAHLIPMFGLQSQPSHILIQTPTVKKVQPGLLPQSLQVPSEEDSITESTQVVEPVQISEDTVDKISRFFEADGEDSLTAKVIDFKGKTKKEQQKRFIILYTWAYQHHFNQPLPSKEHMYAAAKKSKLFDNNFQRYLDEVIREHLYPVGSGHKLNSQGLVSANKIVEEMGDTAKIGVDYWKGNLRPKMKRGILSKEEEQRISDWISLDLDYGKLDIRNLGSSTNCAMFALWALTRKLQVIPAVKPKMAYQYLKGKFTTVPIKLKSFTSALSRISNASKFKKNEDGLYYITEEAEREVLAWTQGGSISRIIDPDSNDDDGDDDDEHS